MATRNARVPARAGILYCTDASVDHAGARAWPVLHITCAPLAGAPIVDDALPIIARDAHRAVPDVEGGVEVPLLVRRGEELALGGDDDVLGA